MKILLKKLEQLIIFGIIFSAQLQQVLARGGGGGSGGGGGGGGGSSRRSFQSISETSQYIKTNPYETIIVISIIILFPIIFGLITYIYKKKRQEKISKQISQSASKDNFWNEINMTETITNTFMKFQDDWSHMEISKMPTYLTNEFYKKTVLHLNVLKNLNRKNTMEDIHINSIYIESITDEINNSNDQFVANITARAKDSLVNTIDNSTIYTDRSTFTEHWHFVRDDNEWKLDNITQITENPALNESDIKNFAKANKFYYDPDFGWLMMPDNGVIFDKTNFQTSDINNHVVGYFRDKIVEFYTYIPNKESSMPTNYIVAQAILPKTYNNILIKRKGFFNFAPWGLRKIQLESADFNKKFCLYAHRLDEANSFELLTPNFMEKIYELPFDINIEMVGNVLYFYSKSRKDINYDTLLKVISWAFDEMKM